MSTKYLLDRDRVRELFDLRGSYMAKMGGGYEDDPNPVWHELREQAPVHAGTVHELTGYSGPAFFQGLPHPDRPHFSAFSYEACAAAYRTPELFASSLTPVDVNNGKVAALNSMLSMDGEQHRRFRALVQPSFIPKKAQWWILNWIEESVGLLIDSFIDDGHAELNVDFCAAIPVLTITSSFGISVEQALDVRAVMNRRPEEIVQILEPIVAARRESPGDDLISVLVNAELANPDGSKQRLTDAEIYSFSVLLLMAGSGTTWKQMGIVLTALLQRPALLEQVRENPDLLRPTIEESLRWAPTDPMFSRFVTQDVDYHGVHMPAGSVLHICIGAANRDPERWENPDQFDIDRPLQPSLAFGGGVHTCLGMHVAKAEMRTGIAALLERLPNLRLDPDLEPPRLIGMYERGATEIPVLFG
ncbi:cytochrome P450 [Nocardia noduli]|uniref:cytochrome P450 n=1 Tax=Nocardia noduli TaxID=2815722 RepID=UPI001C22792C|nr:cytochrome P450 [Nocardia noduli]